MKAAVLKTVRLVRVSGVRILSPPPIWRDARAWLNGAASKAAVPSGTGGSNPPLSVAIFRQGKLYIEAVSVAKIHCSD